MVGDSPALFSRIAAGERIPANQILEALELDLPLICQLDSTPQDPEWHAEGNVRIHTERVVDELYEVLEAATVTPNHRLALVLGAALHDIGKVLTTSEKEISGKIRIVSPRHAIRGRSYAALRLGILHQPVRDLVLGCIGYHHHPKQLVSKHDTDAHYRRLARCADLKSLYLLEIADLRGRDCGDPTEQLEILELFRMRAEELGHWESADPYADWNAAICDALPGASPATVNYVLAKAIHDYEAGLIFTLEEALAKTYKHREKFCEVVVTCGLSGSGKTTWVKENLPSYRVISLDAIRGELTGKEDDQSMNGQVMQLAKARLRESLRRQQNVVWESTGLRRDGRAMVVGLAHDYHATSRIVAFETPPGQSIAQNRHRKSAIPQSVIEKQLCRLEWPEVTEADRIQVMQIRS
ncbi:MAG: AAA family ATPase [Verrucomicrobiales bacterium]